MNIVIIYGPQGCGKTRRTQQFKDHFKCARVIDDWNGIDPLQDGDLALTCLNPPFKIVEARSIPYVNAKQVVTGIDKNELVKKGGTA
jgi:hypothetical protein